MDFENIYKLGEQAPTGTEARVCELITRRQQLGVAKYGTTVAGNPLSLRQWLQHGLEEALDLAVYLQRSIEALDASGAGLLSDEDKDHLRRHFAYKGYPPVVIATLMDRFEGASGAGPLVAQGPSGEAPPVAADPITDFRNSEGAQQ